MSSNNVNKESVLRHARDYTAYLSLAVLWVIFNIFTRGSFTSFRNLSNLINQMGPTAIVSIGVCMCLITGNIDLSAGSLVGLSSAVIAIMYTNLGTSPVVALLTAVLACVVVGIWNGYWIAYKAIPAFIVTLSSQMFIKGLTLLITKGSTVPIDNDLLSSIGTRYLPSGLGYVLGIVLVGAYLVLRIIQRRSQKKYGLATMSTAKEVTLGAVVFGLVATLILILNSYRGVPYSAVILLLMISLFSFVLAKTKFGRYIYALGGNKRATYYAGIDYKKQLMKVYIMDALLAGLAGFMLMSRLSGASPTSGTGMELDGVAACVIGGVSLSGGKGKVIGTLIGALIMTSINNGMSLLNLDSSLQYVVKGLILLVAVWFDVSGQKKQAV